MVLLPAAASVVQAGTARRTQNWKVRASRPGTDTGCSLDWGNRQYKTQRSDQLPVADVTSLSIWQGQMLLAIFKDDYACRFVGSRVGSKVRTEFVVNARAIAICREPASQDAGLNFQSARHSQTGSLHCSKAPGRGRTDAVSWVAPTILPVERLCRDNRRPIQNGVRLPTRAMKNGAHHWTLNKPVSTEAGVIAQFPCNSDSNSTFYLIIYQEKQIKARENAFWY